MEMNNVIFRIHFTISKIVSYPVNHQAVCVVLCLCPFLRLVTAKYYITPF